MSSLYAKSTIAMSAYNYIAFSRKALVVSEIHAGILNQHPEITEEEVLESLKQLVQIGHVFSNSEIGFDIKDPLRRLIVGRDRSDAWFDDGGNITGGWNGWLIRDSSGATLPINTGVNRHGVC